MKEINLEEYLCDSLIGKTVDGHKITTVDFVANGGGQDADFLLYCTVESSSGGKLQKTISTRDSSILIK